MAKKQFRSGRFLFGLICLLAAVALPMVLTTNYYIQLFSQTLINLIAVLGLNVVMGMAGQSNLGTIGIVALGSYTASLIAQSTSQTTLIGLMAAVLVGVLIGFLLGYPSLRVSGIFLALTTTSVAQIVFSLSNNMQWLTGGAMGVKGYPLPKILFWQIANQRQLYYFILFFAVLLIITSIRMTGSKWGRAMRAVRDNPEAVGPLGLSLTKLKIMAFLMATILGCLAGAFYAWVTQYVAPTSFSTDNGTRFIVILMLGGIGSTAGVILGSIIVTLLPEALRFMGDYYQLVFYSFALVLLLVYPRGLSHFFMTLPEKIRALARGKSLPVKEE